MLTTRPPKASDTYGDTIVLNNYIEYSPSSEAISRSSTQEITLNFITMHTIVINEQYPQPAKLNPYVNRFLFK
jgi:hypothetical protein